MAHRALGTKFKIGSSGSTAVADLTSIGGLDLTADTLDVTTLDSENGYREFIQGFKDGGDVSIEGHFTPETGKGQKEMYDLFESGEKEVFIIEFPTTPKATWNFEGIVTGFTTGADLEDPLSFSATVKVTGKPTLEIETGA